MTPHTSGKIFCGLTSESCIIKHGGGSVIIFRIWMTWIDATMNSALYQKMLKKKVKQKVNELKLKLWVCSRTMNQNTAASPPLDGYNS